MSASCNSITICHGAVLGVFHEQHIDHRRHNTAGGAIVVALIQTGFFNDDSASTTTPQTSKASYSGDWVVSQYGQNQSCLNAGSLAKLVRGADGLLTGNISLSCGGQTWHYKVDGYVDGMDAYGQSNSQLNQTGDVVWQLSDDGSKVTGFIEWPQDRYAIDLAR
ncbi:MAG: hypothetical protein AB8B85_14140 [Paracoccaceae bacterium]